ncbi:TonB-dependent siderophore receptor [Ancylobacter defluvii]|uniref:Ligand-gated channel n=1 Tax=Ancylobacter defluvii TaxID=1282440 RepID=A0A9W6JYC1_9HYPH|nr:TonB-dependent siderophore receptor [Ancylobacter defluvii]MBS7586839.1 TonB-dependent siderophore receptor [Ancylobacter defluvii]GLK86145.1 ligand-gated channel [Ancylobacter defluvii]
MRVHLMCRASWVALLILLPAISPASAQSRGEGAITLDTVEVTGDDDRGDTEGFVARRTAAGTKTDSPIETTPISISVVTSDQIEIQGSQTVQEALRYEAGVISDARPGNRYDSIIMRGFGGFGGNANYVQFWDGLRLFKGVNYAVPSIDPYLLQSIDIVRGPMSTIYGQTNPGGSIDLVSKWPDAGAKNEIIAGIGSYGEAELGVDLNGKLLPDGSALYRLIALGRLTDSEVNGSEGERILVAPMVSFKPAENTRVELQATYERDPESYYSTWLPALGTLQANPNGQIPRNFSPNESPYSGFDRTQWSLGYRIEHDVDTVWTLRQNFRYLWLDTDFKALSALPNANVWAPAASCRGQSYLCMGLSPSRYIESLEGLTLDNQAQATFSTGALDHTMLFGVDLQRYDADATYGTGSTVYVNYLSPVWNNIASPKLTTSQSADRTQLGGYAQDQITYGNWHALLGMREDYLTGDTTTETLASGSKVSYSSDDTAFTYRGGLLYQFDNGIAPYVSYATSFDPVIGTGYGGVPFAPTTARQFEAGVKYQPTSFNGLFTASYYELTQRNVLTADTQHTSTNTAVTLCSSATCQTQTGEVESHGFEFSGKAEVLPGLNLTLAYAYTDAEVTQSNVAGVQGKTPTGVPRNAASAWVDYTWSTGTLAGLTLGGGARYIGESYGDQTNTVAMIVPDRVLFDAALHYDFGGTPGGDDGWRFSLTGQNLADKYYVSACASAYQCFVGTGRSVLATLAYHW